MLSMVVCLEVLMQFTLQVFFVGSLVGLLVVTELTRPLIVVPQWRVRLRRLIWICMLLFVVFVIYRVYAIFVTALA
jgi:multisubunit Na+/H+ antiporter MnhE subunit